MKNILLVIAVALFATSIPIVSAEDWHMFHHDAALSGISSSTAPNTNDVLWTYNTGFPVKSSPAIVNGILYIGGTDGKLYANDAISGLNIWSYPTGGPIRSSPAVANGIVYILSEDGKLYAVDAGSGLLKWGKLLGNGPWDWSSPAVKDGKVFIGVSTGDIYSIDAITGDILWQSHIGGTPDSPIAVANGKVYSGTHNFDTSSKTLVALNENDGTIAWTYDYTTNHPGLVGMIDSNGVAVVDGDRDGKLDVYFGLYVWDDRSDPYFSNPVGVAAALNEIDGTEKWIYTFRPIMRGESTSTPAVHNGRVYIGSDDAYLYALDAGTGAKVWDFQTMGAVWSAPAVADGNVIFGSLDHTVYALNEETGALVWSYYTGASRIMGSPAVVNGIVYVGNENGNIYAFGGADTIGPVTTITTINPVPVNIPVTISASVDDSTTGGSNIASAEYTIDGGMAIQMNAQDGAFNGPVEIATEILPLTLTSTAGVHSVCVSGKDSAGNVGNQDCTLLVVYDPNGGFVTGGGWINSPAGAYIADSMLTGKANFGFVSKYQKGATVPTGETEFQFQAGDLNFHSNTYYWLVVAGQKAMYKGIGNINGGAEEYKFILSAIDSDMGDKFRIKITDMSDNVIYDNQIGSDETADPTTVISGGSIVIHTKK